jgi:signal transduction histidine kinase
VVELRMPLELLGTGLWLSAVDVDDPEERQPVLRLATSEPPVRAPALRPARAFGRVLLASAEIDRVIAGLGATQGRRIWVVGPDGRVRARGGSLARPPAPPPESWLGKRWFEWILAGPVVDRSEEPSAVGRLTGPAVAAALGGTETVRWRPWPAPAEGGELANVSAAHPIRSGDTVLGAGGGVEASQPIQTARRRALADLFGTTLLSSVLAALVILAFATRLGTRIRRLRDAAERAIDPHGRVVGPLARPRAGDEIGDLGRSFADMLERLRRYHQHLEQLGGRLSHELRTPIAVVRSSLENLEHAAPGERHTYAARAMDGLTRLATIVTRMSEATRIEQAIEAAEVAPFDLARILGEAAEGYAATWPDHPLESRVGEAPVRVIGVPDLFVQLLDKLVANAIEFSLPGTPIRIALTVVGAQAVVSVRNQGPPIPAALGTRLFDSLVSERPPGEAGPPHLGLGLYIARLIAEVPRGRMEAAIVPGGVEVTVRLPVAD